MTPRDEVRELKRRHTATLRGLADVLRQIAARDVYIRDRLLELHQRLRVLEQPAGIPPPAPPPAWPEITVPPELRGLLED